MNTTTIALGAEKSARRAHNIAEAIVNRFRTWRANRETAHRAKLEKELAASFDIEHRDGRMFITCDGIAFEEIDSACTIEDAAALLRQARENANNFKSLTRL